jgi:hypothetical protein
MVTWQSLIAWILGLRLQATRSTAGLKPDRIHQLTLVRNGTQHGSRKVLDSGQRLNRLALPEARHLRKSAQYRKSGFYSWKPFDAVRVQAMPVATNVNLASDQPESKGETIWNTQPRNVRDLAQTRLHRFT